MRVSVTLMSFLFTIATGLCRAQTGAICIGGNVTVHFDTTRETVTLSGRLYSFVKETFVSQVNAKQITHLLNNASMQPLNNDLTDLYNLESTIAHYQPGFSAENADSRIYYHCFIDNCDTIVMDTIYDYRITSVYRWGADSLTLQTRQIKHWDEFDEPFGNAFTGPFYNDPETESIMPGHPSRDSIFKHYGLVDSGDAAVEDTAFNMDVVQRDLDGDGRDEIIVCTKSSSNNPAFGGQKNYLIEVFKKGNKGFNPWFSFGFGDIMSLNLSAVRFKKSGLTFIIARGVGPCGHFRYTSCANFYNLIPLGADNANCIQGLEY